MTISGKAAVIAALLVTSGCAAAGTAASTIDKADVAWMLVATTLVLFMTIPGIALFLRRHEPQEKRALRFGADNRYLLCADIGVVCCGLLSGVCPR